MNSVLICNLPATQIVACAVDVSQFENLASHLTLILVHDRSVFELEILSLVFLSWNSVFFLSTSVPKCTANLYCICLREHETCSLPTLDAVQMCGNTETLSTIA